MDQPPPRAFGGEGPPTTTGGGATASSSNSKSSLLAVLLVTSSSRGSHLAFRWPRKPRVLKRHSKVRYYAAEEEEEEEGERAAKGRSGGANGNGNGAGKERGRAGWQTPFSTVRDRAAAVRGVDLPSKQGRGAVLDSFGLENIDAGNLDDEQHPSGFWSDDQGSVTSPSESSVTSSSDEDVDGSTTGVEESQSYSGRRARLSSSVAFNTAGVVRRQSRSTTGSRPPLRRTLATDTSTAANDLDRRESDAGNSEVGGASSHANTHDGNDLGAAARERNLRAHKTYFGYDCDFLASLLSPKPELCHQKFEMVIDDLAFVGHPVYLRGEGDGKGEEEDSGDEFERRGRQGPSRRDQNGTEKQSQQQESQPQNGKTKASPSSKLDLFQFVLVLDRPDPSVALLSMDLTSYLQFFYDNVVFKMTAALYAEQKRANYIAEEADKLIALRDRCMDDGQSLSAYNAQCLGISSLARSMKDIYQSLSTSSDAFVTINDNVEAHLQLPPIMRSSSLLLKVADIETHIDPLDPLFLSGGGFAGLGKESNALARLMSLEPEELVLEEWTRTTGPYLLPWKTLLLVNDVSEHFQSVDAGKMMGLQDRAEEAGQSYEHLGLVPWARKFVNLLQPTLSGIPT